MTDYEEYLRTEHWDNVRLQALRRAGNRCQLCGSSDTTLHVHHNNYEHLWGEGESDVIVLCTRCHAWHHQAKAMHEAYAGMVCPHCGAELAVTMTAVKVSEPSPEDEAIPW